MSEILLEAFRRSYILRQRRRDPQFYELEVQTEKGRSRLGTWIHWPDMLSTYESSLQAILTFLLLHLENFDSDRCDIRSQRLRGYALLSIKKG